MSSKAKILAINCGSSSLKFAVHNAETPYLKILSGRIDRIGTDDARLLFSRHGDNDNSENNVLLSHHKMPVNFLFTWLKLQDEFSFVKAIGHRLVYGATDTKPKIISSALLKELRQASKLSPNHLPAQLHLVDMAKKYFPGVPQVACYDSDFHKTLPGIARLLPIPRCYSDMGLQRYGYHGISCNYVMEELARISKSKTATNRVIIAHLGNGSSLTAVKKGQSIDTTMGFTSTGGLPMGTRTGDLDPGIILYLMEKERLTLTELTKLINQRSGLLGVSESSSDMIELLREEANDVRAAEAIELFCYRVKKEIGAYSAVLGGADTLVFTGGIGEHQPVIRQRICEGLQYLGIEIDPKRNKDNDAIISPKKSKVLVRVIQTDEERLMAKMVYNTLNL